MCAKLIETKSLVPYEEDYLMHFGIKGQRWGVRRFQNADGSLTSAGKARYGDGKGTKYQKADGSITRKGARVMRRAVNKYDKIEGWDDDTREEIANFANRISSFGQEMASRGVESKQDLFRKENADLKKELMDIGKEGGSELENYRYVYSKIRSSYKKFEKAYKKFSNLDATDPRVQDFFETGQKASDTYLRFQYETFHPSDDQWFVGNKPGFDDYILSPGFVLDYIRSRFNRD